MFPDVDSLSGTFVDVGKAVDVRGVLEGTIQVEASDPVDRTGNSDSVFKLEDSIVEDTGKIVLDEFSEGPNSRVDGTYVEKLDSEVLNELLLDSEATADARRGALEEDTKLFSLLDEVGAAWVISVEISCVDSGVSTRDVDAVSNLRELVSGVNKDSTTPELVGATVELELVLEKTSVDDAK